MPRTPNRTDSPALPSSRTRRPRQALAGIVAALACLASVATTALADQTIAYSVQPGDSVYGLARQFGDSPDHIVTSNNLSHPNVLTVGQTLLIIVSHPLGAFGAIVPDRRADIFASDPAIVAFDPNQTVNIPSSTGPFGAIAPDRRDDVGTNATVGPATVAAVTANLLKETSPVISPAPATPAAAVAAVAPATPAPTVRIVTTATPTPVVPITATPTPAVPITATPTPAAPITATATPAPPVTATPAPPRDPAIMSAPYYSQFDGSIWAEGNCGPTTLSMALGALGVSADQITLRGLANKQMKIYNPSDGTTWESLAYAAKVSGVLNRGLYNSNGKGYRSWSIGGLKTELAKGHPVILLVHFKALPDHLTSAYYGDHYIVALGFDASGNLVYNDPAFKTSPGSDRKIDPAQLQIAWSRTAAGLTRTAVALYR